MSFIPKAIVCKKSRSVIHVINSEEQFNSFYSEGVEILDVEGFVVHPRNVKVGDLIGFDLFGGCRHLVKGIEFVPAQNDLPNFHRAGIFSFATDKGTVSVAIDGRTVKAPDLYVFTKP